MYSNAITDTLILLHSIQRQEFKEGWLIHYFHVSGASILFTLIYLHMTLKYTYAKGLNPGNWLTGIITLFIWMFVGFLGYILPWGQMSFWAATVISEILPRFLVNWAIGNFWLNNVQRIFAIHYILPILTLVTVTIHMFYLHEKGSLDILGTPSILVSFYPLALNQDLANLTTVYALYVLSLYITVSNPSNGPTVDRTSTPLFIEPEWYYIALYTILKSFPNIHVGKAIFVYYIVMLSIPAQEFSLIRIKLLAWCFLLQIYLGTVPATIPCLGLGMYIITLAILISTSR